MAELFHFGLFELDLRAGELRKRGIRVRLQEQPLQILALLIESAGEVVTREQIQKKLWCSDTFVDFDNAINSAVRKMRDALGDDSASPRFVETVARRGYRFIAPVNPHLPTAPPVPQKPLAPPEPLAKSRTRLYWLSGVLCAASLLAGGLTVLWLRPGYVEPPTVSRLTYSGRDYSPAVSPDGNIVAYSSDRDGTPKIWVKQMKGGGEVARTSGPDSLPRFSPKGESILFSRSDGTHRSLYKVATVGGDPQKVIDDALDGDFSGDGQIAFVRWKQVNQHHTSYIGISAADGSDAVIIAELQDVRLDFPRWSPDGSTIATIGAPASVSGEIFTSVWLLFRTDNKQPRQLRPLLPERGISSVVWQDNRTLIYSRGDRAAAVTAELIAHDTVTDTVRRTSWRCCNLTLDRAGSGGLVFDELANRAGLRELGPDDRWISHDNSPDRQPVYSPDGKWIAFSSNRDGHMNLWQISLETGKSSRLSENNSTDFDLAFSPDGGKLVFSSDRSGHFEIYMANRDGSGARQVTHDETDAENPTMTPDSQWIVYASDGPKRSGIWKVHPDGTNATQIVRGLGSNPEVSPDGVCALYLVNPQADRAEIRFVRISDGVEMPDRIECRRRRQNGVTLGRARWVPSPDGKNPLAIAFIDQDASGATGVSIQDFVNGHVVSQSRKPLRPFDTIAPIETLGVSPDGKRLIVSVLTDDTSSILWSSHVPRL